MKLTKFFIFGILAAAGAMASELILSSLCSILFNINIETNYFQEITFFLIAVILIEEFFKLILLQNLFSTSMENSRSKIFSALIFGSGFALFEITSKLLSLPQQNSLSVFYFNLAGIFLIHTTTAGIIGFFLAKKTALSRTAIIMQAIFFSSILHLAYNLLVIYF